MFETRTPLIIYRQCLFCYVYLFHKLESVSIQTSVWASYTAICKFYLELLFTIAKVTVYSFSQAVHVQSKTLISRWGDSNLADIGSQNFRNRFNMKFAVKKLHLMHGPYVGWHPLIPYNTPHILYNFLIACI